MIKKYVVAAAATIFAFAAAPAHAGLVYIGTFGGNDNASGNNNGANNDIHDEVFAYNGDTTVEYLAKINLCESDEDNCQLNGQKPEDGAVSASLFTLTMSDDQEGTVNFNLTGSGSGLEYIALKASNSFALFYWDMDPLVGSFSFDVGDFIAHGLSHITFYGGDAPSEVPLPAAAWLMIAGLGGLRFAGRRKAA